MKTSTLIIAGVALVGIGVAGYLGYKYLSTRQPSRNPAPGATNTPGNSTLPGQISSWESTISGLWSGVHSIFTGTNQQPGNATTQSPAAATGGQSNDAAPTSDTAFADNDGLMSYSYDF